MATTLDHVKPGSRARIINILHQGGWVYRMYQLGVFPGVEVEVVYNDGRGPIVLRVGDSEIVVGRGLARRIIVESSGGS
ncbi:MAG: FeoA family protein [Desulfurococcus sp.]|jgi:ferrous iron transport protein A|uniref:FeoA family protein n=1 Tax=Desulfurococcus sp. TaxID=51678 RepID=UPI00315FC0CC